MFHMSGRPSGGTMSRGSMRLSGSAKERPSQAWGEGAGEGGRGSSAVVRWSWGIGHPFWCVKDQRACTHQLSPGQCPPACPCKGSSSSSSSRDCETLQIVLRSCLDSTLGLSPPAATVEMDKGKGLCGNGGNGKSVAEQRWLWVLQTEFLGSLPQCTSRSSARRNGYRPARR